LIGSNKSDVDVDDEQAVEKVAGYDDADDDDDKSESPTLVKSAKSNQLDASSEAESSFSEHLAKLDDDFCQMNLNPMQKSQLYKQ
jgi:hypothetical protein